jgi:ATP-dependent Clp protease ATP-binding subunit ClpC
MGARPLKRAIDQYVLAPIAATIVERRFPEGDQFVFVRSDGKSIQAEFVDPDLDVDAPRPAQPQRGSEVQGAPPPLAAMILSATGSPEEQTVLAAGLQEIETTLASPAWEKLQNDGLERMREADFWSRPDRHETLAQIALMDRVKAAADTAFSLQARQAKGSERAGKSSRELVQRLALQIHLVKDGIADVVAAAPVEVAVVVEPALTRPGLGDDDGTPWCGRVLDMYRAWARSRHMQVTEMASSSQRRLPWLLVSGFGAHRVLTQEMGLHVLEQDDGGATDRFTARVRVVAAPLGDAAPDRLKREIKTRLDALPATLAIVRRYREAPSPLVRQMTGAPWRSGKLDAVLAGNFDLIPLAQRPD